MNKKIKLIKGHKNSSVKKRTSKSGLYNEQLDRWTSYKNGAKSRNHYFDLEPHHFIKLWKEKCMYCGRKIDTIGIDRVDNSKGYSIDNIVPCCINCNRMKMAQSVEDFINNCRDIWNNFDKQYISRWRKKLGCLV